MNIRLVLLALGGLMAVGLPGLLIAGSNVPFPGRELGARQAAERGAGMTVNASSASNGLQLQITGFVADEIVTVISYTLRGREAEGSTALAKAPPQLIDANGRIYVLRRGSLDPADRRAGTWVFPAIPAQSGTLTVLVEDFELGTPRDNQPITLTDVPGTWRVQFAWNGQRAPAGPSASSEVSERALGRGTVRLEGVKHSAVGVAVTGTLEGFPPEAIQAMGCPGRDIERSDGSRVAWISCRLGFGEGYRSFEIIYPSLDGNLTINFALTYPQSPSNARVPAAVKSDEGATTAFSVNLPAQ